MRSNPASKGQSAHPSSAWSNPSSASLSPAPSAQPPSCPPDLAARLLGTVPLKTQATTPSLSRRINESRRGTTSRCSRTKETKCILLFPSFALVGSFLSYRMIACRRHRAGRPAMASSSSSWTPWASPWQWRPGCLWRNRWALLCCASWPPFLTLATRWLLIWWSGKLSTSQNLAVEHEGELYLQRC